MINDETKRKLRELGLSEIITILEIQEKEPDTGIMPFDERLQYITDYLYQEKYNSKVKRLIKLSRFRLPNAEVHDIYYEDRGINKNAIIELSTCQFINNNTNVIFQGFTGSGKTFLSCAIGKQACKNQIRTRYIRLPDLISEFNETKMLTNSCSKLLRKYNNVNLLIIDEWLLDEISSDEQHFIFELIERRYDHTSTIFCTQYKVADWHDRLGGGVHADAIMDRIVHNAIWIESGTLNMRKHNSKKNSK